MARREQPLVLGSGVDRKQLGGLGPVGHAAASAPLMTTDADAIAVAVLTFACVGVSVAGRRLRS
jgi:hypothetical protein